MRSSKRLLARLPVFLAILAASPAPGAEGGADRPRLPAATGSVQADSAATAAQARTLMRQRRYEAALTVLRPLVRQDPKHLGTRFLLGLAAFQASQKAGLGEDTREALLDEAVSAFRTMLIDRPDLVRVRLELARTFFHQGEDSLSREHFERVLAGSPAPAVAANVRLFLGAIRARRRWRGYFGAALAPDTNIGRRSDTRIIYLWGLPFRRSEESLPRSGIGLSVWTGGEYQYPMGRRRRLRAGAGISRREYARREFDRTFLSAHAGPRWLLDADTTRACWRAFGACGARARRTSTRSASGPRPRAD